MGELIKVKNEEYSEYEELLLRRDQLRKEAHICQGLYMKEFGDLITTVFEKKISCIQKKKTISFCQAAINRGESVNQDEMQAWIQREMAEYQARLDQMIAENEAAHNMGSVTQAELAKIKRLYHKLTKLLHPDINPKTDAIPELKELWHRVVVSYTGNDLKGLEEAEVLIKRALETNDFANMEIEIPNLAEKIKEIREEIQQIKETDPYQYKFLLEDEDLVREKKEALEAELKEYENYEAELDQIMKGLITSGVSFTWRMN